MRQDTDIYVAIDEGFERANEETRRFPVPIYFFNKRGYPELVGSGFFMQFEGGLFLVTAYHVIAELNNAGSPWGIGFSWKIEPIKLAGMASTKETYEEKTKNDLDLAALVVAQDEPRRLDFFKCAVDYNQTTDGLYFSDGVAYGYFTGFPLSQNKIRTWEVDETGGTGGSLANFQFEISSRKSTIEIDKDPEKFITLEWNKKTADGRNIPSVKGCSGGPLWLVRRSEGKMKIYLAGVFIEFHRQKRLLVCARIEGLISFLRSSKPRWKML